MKGNPKFKCDEEVKFQFNNEIIEGTIYIIDKYGTFSDPSDVSYDIISIYNGEKCLFKHITEKLVSKLDD